MQKTWIETENSFGQSDAMKKSARGAYAIEVGQRLAAARAAAGFSQIAFAKRLGFSTAAKLSNWENGWSMVPPEYAAKIFLLTKVDANYLYLGDATQLPYAIYERLFPPGQTGQPS